MMIRYSGLLFGPLCSSFNELENLQNVVPSIGNNSRWNRCWRQLL